MLMGYEALRDLPVEDVEIKTPIETCRTPMIAGKKLAIVPILRAGLGMVSGILSLVPSAKVGHIGLYRDEETHEPHEYYCKLPESIDERISVIVDPMLATGGSAEAAIDFVKKQGGKNIKFMCIIAAPEGLKRLHEAHPDVQIYCGSLDRELNENAYICPGLGDAGDIEDLGQLRERVEFALRVLSLRAPAEQGDVVEHGLGQIALADEVLIARVAVTLGHLVLRVAHDGGAVDIRRDLPAEGFVEQVVFLSLIHI